MSKKNKPPKSLTVSLKKTGGRNSAGRVTTRHRGGGSRRLYRKVNFGQEKMDVKGKVERIEYDPNRSAHLALLSYQDGGKGYILAPEGLKEGDEVITSQNAPLKPGNRIPLKNIPVGTPVYNISLYPDGPGKMVRAAGTSATILAHEGGYAQIRMPSREIRKINQDCFASIGELSNPEHRYKDLKKAGTARRKGRRPVVRGSAMNPVDHPHGGGEGRAPIGMPHPKTPTGKIARGVKTRRRKNTDKYIIKKRSKKKRK